jgi:ubiquinone/menaquinone biosynthesis C-methylase UbiE/uncharacterized protein YbaR (Trm112 family)
MKPSSIALLKCPACGHNLALGKPSNASEIKANSLACDCGQRYPIQDGVPDFVSVEQLLPTESEFRTKYDLGAEQYDQGLDWLFQSFYEDEETVRKQMTDHLAVKAGSRVLEIGCGTGKDSVHILKRLGKRGELFLLELSGGMLALAKKRLAASRDQTEYLLANATSLPFQDRTFDAVFHFGGLNVFGDIRQALAEFTRVTKVGGRVVVGDEGTAPWLRKKTYGKILAAANPLYKHTPPMDLLPENVGDVSLHWLLGNAFYLITYRVTAEPPKLNLDLPIPGKRGGTLRSRYYGESS